MPLTPLDKDVDVDVEDEAVATDVDEIAMIAAALRWGMGHGAPCHLRHP